MSRYNRGLEACIFPNKKISITVDHKDKNHKNLIASFDVEPDSVAFKNQLPVEIRYFPAIKKKADGRYTTNIKKPEEAISFCYVLAEFMIDDIVHLVMSDTSMYVGTGVVNAQTGDEFPCNSEDLEYLSECRCGMSVHLVKGLQLVLARKIACHFKNQSEINIDTFFAFVCQDIVKDFKNFLNIFINDGTDRTILIRLAMARASEDGEYLRRIFVQQRSAGTQHFDDFCDDDLKLCIWYNSDMELMFGCKNAIGFIGDVYNNLSATSNGFDILTSILNDDIGIMAYIISACDPSSVVIYDDNDELADYLRNNNQFFALENISVVHKRYPKWYNDQRDYIDSGRQDCVLSYEKTLAEDVLGISVEQFYGMLANEQNPFDLMFGDKEDEELEDDGNA